MLRELHEQNLHTTYECREYVGTMFRAKITELAPWAEDLEATDFLLNHCVMIHLDDYKDKCHALIYMAQKLYDLVQSKCKVSDSEMSLRVTSTGFLISRSLFKLLTYIFI